MGTWLPALVLTAQVVSAQVVINEIHSNPDATEGDPPGYSLELDRDGDTFTNLQEYLAGTSPRDSSSRLQFHSVSATRTTVTLQFHAAADGSDSVQCRDAVHTGPWMKLRDVGAEPSLRTVTLDDALTAGAPERYYRLAAPAQP